MKRVYIRDNRSRKKPRILDYIRTEDGTELIETKDDKDDKVLKTILLDDFLSQIEEARKIK